VYVVIAGSGRLGSGLARVLSSEGKDVAVIDEPLDRRRLGSSFDGLTVEGNPIDPETLELAGIRKAELFVAAMPSDNMNAAAVQAAREIFMVPMAIARFVDPERELFYRGLGFETVCPTTTGLNQVLDHIRNSAFSPLRATIDPDMTCVLPREDWIGLPLRDIRLSAGRRVAGLVRNGKIREPADAVVVRADDTIVLSRNGR